MILHIFFGFVQERCFLCRWNQTIERKYMKKIVMSVALLGAALTATAGGYLTNTNQNVAFLRNPAQDAAINLNGVYSNPAGVSFLKEGFHLGLNLQSAYQIGRAHVWTPVTV